MSSPLRLDRYELLEPIASGGMATVYRGRALGAGGFERLVAIKVMHEHLAMDPEFVAMFLDEARLAANIRHPNVVPTFDVQEDAHGVFIVLEYIEGSSLYGVLRVLRKHAEILPIGVTLRIMFDVLQGLHAAHDLVNMEGRPLGLVHRDVSPQNILVGNDGMGRITDFGIARAESRLTTTRGGQLKGRLAYMSPEVIRSERANRQSDVYAAGVVLWEMLTGEPLFVADNDAALMAVVLGGPRRAPRELNPEVPWQIDEVCMRALEDPSDRYRTAAAFAEALERAAEKAATPIAMPRVVASYARRAHAERPRSTAPPPRLRPREPSRAGRTQLLEPPPLPSSPRATMPMATSPFPAAIPPPTIAAHPPPLPQPPPLPTVSWTPAPGTPVSHTNLSNAAIMLPSVVPAPPRPASRATTLALVAAASLVTGVAVWFVAHEGAATPSAAPVVAPAPSFPPAVPPPAASPVVVAAEAPSASASAEPKAAPPEPTEAPGTKPPAPPPATPRAPSSEPAPSPALAPTPKAPSAPPPGDSPPPSKAFRPDEL